MSQLLITVIWCLPVKLANLLAFRRFSHIYLLGSLQSLVNQLRLKY